MPRLDEELAAREASLSRAEAMIRAKYDTRKGKLKNLAANGDFQEFLTLLGEVNNPEVLVGIECSDPKCMAVKRQIKTHRQVVRLIEKLAGEPAAKAKSGRGTKGTGIN